MLLDKLYPYQLNTAKKLADLGFGVDLSDVGTGKTITAFGVMVLSQAKHILIITPKTVCEQWKRKASEFYSDLEVHSPIASGKQARRNAIIQYYRSTKTPKCLLITYEQMRAEIDLLQTLNFDLVYLDECHRIGNPMTKLYRALQKIRSKYRFGATATPLRSSPLQAYGIFNWVKPGLLGKNYFHFKFRYTVLAQRNWVVGYKNLDELGEIIKPYFVKNKMEDVGIYLPPLVEEDLIFDLGVRERRLYDNVRREMLLEIEEKEISKIENPTSLYTSVVKLGKLQEITDSLELVGESVESSKLNLLKEHLEDIPKEQKVVVFTRFSRMARILERELSKFNPAIIVGDIKNRQAQIDKFDNDDNCRLMIITTAGNEGVNLQRANILYMYDVPLGSYGSLVQTLGRINRIGQTRKMVVYYLMARDSVDIKLRALLKKKGSLNERIFGSLQDIRSVIE
jgi:non-specific serine/threonine protein kinase